MVRSRSIRLRTGYRGSRWCNCGAPDVVFAGVQFRITLGVALRRLSANLSQRSGCFRLSWDVHGFVRTQSPSPWELTLRLHTGSRLPLPSPTRLSRLLGHSPTRFPVFVLLMCRCFSSPKWEGHSPLHYFFDGYSRKNHRKLGRDLGLIRSRLACDSGIAEDVAATSRASASEKVPLLSRFFRYRDAKPAA